jgi:ribonuclease P protein component
LHRVEPLSPHLSTPACAPISLWRTTPWASLYCLEAARLRAALLQFRLCETDLPAQRAEAEAEARLPRPYGHACRPGDPEAPPGERSQAPLGLSSLDARVHRRHRLSRSRDFDAVYRHGRSVSTRFLVLYWFAREDGADAVARLGLAVPKAVGTAVVRNKMKRRLREALRTRLPELPQDQDYVLVVRPGLAEATDARGFDWLRERIDEILGKAAA